MDGKIEGNSKIQELNLKFLINLGTYKPRYFLIRSLVISITSVILINIATSIEKQEFHEYHEKILVYIISILAFNSISEINLFIMHLFRKSERLRYNFYIQFLVVITVALVLAFMWIQLAQFIFSEVNIFQSPATLVIILTGLLIIVIHLLVIIISNLSKEWIDNRKEIQNLKQAKLQSDYNTLKDRLNPHFLFNNLSVLKSLIQFDKDKAKQFTQDFTNVYRYVLNSHHEQTITIEEELKFLRSYIALHSERIGDGFSTEIDLDDDIMQQHIPPMALQLLIENAIKHNIANKNNPLRVTIRNKADKIIVKNNINHKDSTYSTYTGLTSLDAQYKHLCGKGIHVEESQEFFIVEIPII
jgi:sensor histidine kinase YesM